MQQDIQKMIELSEKLSQVLLAEDNGKVTVILGALEMVVASAIKSDQQDEEKFLDTCNTFYQNIKTFGHLIDVQKKEAYDNTMERR